MIFLLLLYFSISEITVELIQKDLYVSGNGKVTSSILRGNRDYKSFENIFFNGGPFIIEGAFIDMNSLKTISFSENVESFQGGCFFRNWALSKFIVSPRNPHIWTDGTFLYQDNNKSLVGTIRHPSHFDILHTVETLFSSCFTSIVYKNDVIFPKSVSSITGNPFAESTFKSIRFEKGSNLTLIPKDGINWCTINVFAIPPSVTVIQEGAFYQCKTPGLFFEDVEKSKLVSLSRGAFKLCSCERIILPSGITSIPSDCFLSSTLISIKIPINCSKISETAFSGCSELSNVTVDPGNIYYKEVKGSLYSADGKQLVFAPPQLDSFEITPELESISQSTLLGLVKVDKIILKGENEHFSVFEGCLHDKSGKLLKEVCGGVKILNVSAKTTQIQSRACKGVGIISVRFLGSACAYLGDEVFRGCKELTEFCVPVGMESIGSNCFVDSSLAAFTYDSPSSLKSLSPRCFQELKLNTIELPKSLKSISSSTFYNVFEVERFDLEAGSLLERIDDYAFYYFKCTKPCSISLPSTLNTLSQNVFQGCQLEIEFENRCGIKSLPNEVFNNCKGIKGTFMIPSQVETIDTLALAGCENIEKITFEEGSVLKNIMGSAFANCAKLIRLELPEFTEIFDNSAISKCYSLTDFKVNKQNLNFVAEGNILYNYNKTELIACSPGVIDGSVSGDVESIRSNGFFECIKLKTVLFLSPSNLLTISQNTFAGCSNLANLILPTKLREVSDGAFEGCRKLSTVQFGLGQANELLRIGSNVFKGCSMLSQIIINSGSLESIGESAFENCYRLKEFSAFKIKRIGNRCFRSSGIEAVRLDSIESLGEGSFQNCTNLVDVQIESSLIKELPGSLFEGCFYLERLKIPQSVEVLGTKCLSETNLINITIPANVKRIKSECFANVISLREINISAANIEEISTDCFKGCSKLERIIYCSSRGIIGDYGLDSSMCWAFVSSEYEGSKLLGLEVRRQLRDGCVFIDPTATPTALFTVSGGETLRLFVSTAAAVVDASD